VLAIVAPAAMPQSFDYSIMAGGQVPLLSDSGGLVGSDPGTSTTVSPFVAVNVDAPISTFAAGPRLVVDGELGALPGESLEISKPESFRSLKMAVAIAQALSPKLNFGLYAHAGFATRLAGDQTPRDKAPRWIGAGLRFKGDASELIVTLNADQRLSSTADVQAAPGPPTLAYQATVEIKGHVPILRKAIAGQEAKMSVYVNAILGLDLSARYASLSGGRHDVVAVGVAVGI
jgi:hypothetical protein